MNHHYYHPLKTSGTWENDKKNSETHSPACNVSVQWRISTNRPSYTLHKNKYKAIWLRRHFLLCFYHVDRKCLCVCKIFFLIRYRNEAFYFGSGMKVFLYFSFTMRPRDVQSMDYFLRLCYQKDNPILHSKTNIKVRSNQ